MRSVEPTEERELEDGELEDGEVDDGEVDDGEEDSSTTVSTVVVSSSSEDEGTTALSEGTVQVQNYLSTLFSGYVVIISFVSDHDLGS